MKKASPVLLRDRARGFSLTELLVVISIMVILTMLTLPMINSSLQGMSLLQGTQSILDELSVARQVARTRNRAVEVRFYSYASSGGGAAMYRALQSFELQDDGSALPLARVRPLPKGIIMDGSAALSTLLSSARAKVWTALDPKFALPNVGTTYDACAIRFTPEGSTDLPAASGGWFLSLHSENKGDKLAALPANFSLISVDLWTGRTSVYRP